MNKIDDYMKDSNIQKMKKYIQHGDTSTYTHCKNVAVESLKIAKLLNAHINEDVLVKGALLHDFYLYDWHDYDEGAHRLHGYTHADTALKNAKEYFDIDQNIQHVIWCHMWPLNITRVPRTKEAWIVCVADKIVSLTETLKSSSK